jgi:hypothetical protein
MIGANMRQKPHQELLNRMNACFVKKMVQKKSFRIGVLTGTLRINARSGKHCVKLSPQVTVSNGIVTHQIGSSLTRESRFGPLAVTAIFKMAFRSITVA